MANTKSAKKAIRVQERRRDINLHKLNSYKKARKAVLDNLASGDIKSAEENLPHAYKEIDKASKSNTIHPNKASRLKSKLASKVAVAKNNN